MKDIVIIGAGGLGRETAWLIEEINEINPEWNLLGFIEDSTDNIGKKINGYKILGTTEYLNNLSEDIYTIVAIGDGKVREKMVNKLKNRKYATLIHPDVRISKNSNLGVGTIVCSGALISVNTEIGQHCVINFNSIIAHDSKLKDFVTINVNVNISGNVKIDKYSTIGSGASIYQRKEIGENCMIGIGSAVIKKVKSNKTALGVPAEIF
ncbi:MAG: acetyltransferase [Fusobacterium varium]|uniref:acetyltransferase n=1 Tax=Fusobacterium varium TaxID=856 RepID=UPI003994AD4D